VKKLKKFLNPLSNRLAILTIIFGLLLIIYINANKFLVFVTGFSMQPTLSNHEILVFTKDISNIERGDIVVFWHNNEVNIKRIYGVEGDPYYVDCDSPINYYFDTWRWNEKLDFLKLHDIFKLIIPHNKFFVQGDNQIVSEDSTTYGLIDKKDIIGKLV
jgi:signal peptidase I